MNVQEITCFQYIAWRSAFAAWETEEFSVFHAINDNWNRDEGKTVHEQMALTSSTDQFFFNGTPLGF